MDWMTLSIEIVGVVILCVWIVIPVAEFKKILTALRSRDVPRSDLPHSDAPRSDAPHSDNPRNQGDAQ
jgi:hypothetical protein